MHRCVRLLVNWQDFMKTRSGSGPVAADQTWRSCFSGTSATKWTDGRNQEGEGVLAGQVCLVAGAPCLMPYHFNSHLK